MGSNNSVVIRCSAARRVRVLVADPYPVILHGFRKMIEGDGRFQVIAEVSTMPAFREAAAAERPDVALLDWPMASRDIETTTELFQSDFLPYVIFFTASESPEEAQDLRRLGAHIVLTKGCSAKELLMAVSMAGKEAAAHDSGAKPGAANTISSTSTEGPLQRIAQLTKRERQLLPLVCSGMKNKEIAMRLGIAESTVWHHLTSVFTKLGVEDRLGLATFAYRHNMVETHDQPFQTVQTV